MDKKNWYSISSTMQECQPSNTYHLLSRKASTRKISWPKRFRRKLKCETTFWWDRRVFRFDGRSSRTTLVSLGSNFISPKPSVSYTLFTPHRHCYAVSGHTIKRSSGERYTAVQARQNLTTAFRKICDLAPSTASAVRQFVLRQVTLLRHNGTRKWIVLPAKYVQHRRNSAVLKLKEIALGVFLDIEGAFDNTSYVSMCSALTRHRIHQTIVRWIRATLEGQLVMGAFGGVSRSVAVSRGCPQGGGGYHPSYGALLCMNC